MEFSIPLNGYIPSIEPTVAETFLSGLWIVVVSIGDNITPDNRLSRLSGLIFVIVVHTSHLHARENSTNAARITRVSEFSKVYRSTARKKREYTPFFLAARQSRLLLFHLIPMLCLSQVSRLLHLGILRPSMSPSTSCNHMLEIIFSYIISHAQPRFSLTERFLDFNGVWEWRTGRLYSNGFPECLP